VNKRQKKRKCNASSNEPWHVHQTVAKASIAHGWQHRTPVTCEQFDYRLPLFPLPRVSTPHAGLAKTERSALQSMPCGTTPMICSLINDADSLINRLCARARVRNGHSLRGHVRWFVSLQKMIQTVRTSTCRLSFTFFACWKSLAVVAHGVLIQPSPTEQHVVDNDGQLEKQLRHDPKNKRCQGKNVPCRLEQAVSALLTVVVLIDVPPRVCILPMVHCFVTADTRITQAACHDMHDVEPKVQDNKRHEQNHQEKAHEPPPRYFQIICARQLIL
jgi:hypothetical protein